MPLSRQLKSANHHWWPRSLSRYWAAADGSVTQISCDGSEVRGRPASFGAIGNAHHIKFGEDNPWNATFEPKFDRADGSFPELVEWILGLNSKWTDAQASFENRLLAQPLSCERRTQLAHCLSSLIVRSPCSRHDIRTKVNHFLERFGASNVSVPETLIAGNMYHSPEVFSRSIDTKGKFLLLFSDGPEFIWGDGFLHNFPINGNEPFLARCVVPLLPSVAVIYVQPVAYHREPELVTIRVRKDEVEFLNEVVQIYSCRHILYSNDRPHIIDAFAKGEHLMFSNHKHPRLEQLIESLMWPSCRGEVSAGSQSRVGP